MVAVKARYEDGKIVLPPDFAGHKPCEVIVLFHDSARVKRRRAQGEGGAASSR